MRTDNSGYTTLMSVVTQVESFDVECPHCHKGFAAEPIQGGRAARYRGFKCPHCRLFIPLLRATDAGLTRDADAAS